MRAGNLGSSHRPGGSRRELVVSVGSIPFRVHDQVALDAHVRVWAQASAFSERVFARPSAPFSRLIEQSLRLPRSAPLLDVTIGASIAVKIRDGYPRGLLDRPAQPGRTNTLRRDGRTP